MAHFAEIDSNNIVLRVIVLANETIADEDNKEQEQLGLDFIANHLKLPGIWKQTSYNNNFRKQYAFVGGTYDASADEFVNAQPYPSWTLDESNDWQPPVEEPTLSQEQIDDGYATIWIEDKLKWELRQTTE